MSDPQRQKVERWEPGAGEGAWELVFNGLRASVLGDEKVLEMNGGDGYASL